MDDDIAPLGGSLPQRFPWVFAHGQPAPAPTPEQWAQIGPPPPGFDVLLAALDGLAFALAERGQAPVPFPDQRSTQPIPEVLHLYSGAAQWATAHARGLLHRYLSAGGSVNDPDALLLQGILLGAEMSQHAGSTAVFRAGYSPFSRS